MQKVTLIVPLMSFFCVCGVLLVSHLKMHLLPQIMDRHRNFLSRYLVSYV